MTFVIAARTAAKFIGPVLSNCTDNLVYHVYKNQAGRLDRSQNDTRRESGAASHFLWNR